MSEYASIVVKKLELWSFRNYLDMEIVGLFFVDEDLIVTDNVKYEEDDEDEVPHTKYEFVSTVRKAKDRLDAIGYSITNFEKIFDENKYQLLHYEPYLQHLNVKYEEYEEKTHKRINKYVTFSKWKNSIKKFVEYGLINGLFRPDYNKLKINTECDKIIYYSKEDFDEGYLGVKFYDEIIKYMFRLILEFCDDESNITLDASNLFYWDYTSVEDIKIGDVIEKNIVLVEGSSDKRILEFGLKKIYPHLFNLFYFMDFDLGGKVREGSCEMLSKNVITFIASKLKAKFIAVYDNDTVGVFAKNKLEFDLKNIIPDNFRIMNYPNILRAQKFPTLGTNKKIIFDDINGRACSIEIYLPKAVIQNNDEYYPIQWSALKECKIGEQKITDYQGVIINKDLINKSCFELIDQIEKEQAKFNINEWNELKMILEQIVFAFKY